MQIFVVILDNLTEKNTSHSYLSLTEGRGNRPLCSRVAGVPKIMACPSSVHNVLIAVFVISGNREDYFKQIQAIMYTPLLSIGVYEVG